VPAVVAAIALGVVLAGCAAPIAGVWPAAPAAITRTIVVSVDTWHAMIALPAAPAEGPGAAAPARFEEWGYAERGWYLEGRHGSGGALRAMLWPSPGVVEVTRSDRLWAERTPDPPADTFTFALTEIGYRRLREHLRGTIADPAPVATAGASRFYAAVENYSLFHTCHQYAAHTLRAAGLPLTPSLALSRGTFAAQLRRAERMAVAGDRTAAGKPSARRTP
jgi:hypothetical protein